MTWERTLEQLGGGLSRVERRVVDLDLPAALWQQLLRDAAIRHGLNVRTYLEPPNPRTPAEADRQLVVIVLLDRIREPPPR
jgi:hypothetical protein